jgi:hypothetical protein
MQHKVVEWTDEIRRMCHEVCEAPAVMLLLQALSDGTSSLRLIGMREAIAIGDFQRAALLEAEARAWEDMPLLIREIADEFLRNRG